MLDSTKTMAMKTPQKFVGTITWVEQARSDKISIDRAILRTPDELVVDFVYDGLRYTATLRRTAGNEFRGKYTAPRERKPYEGDVSCRLFTSADSVFLFGRWSENDIDYIWWADLNAVEHFADER